MSGATDPHPGWPSASRLRFERRLRGWTQHDLAAQVRRCAGWLSDSDPGVDEPLIDAWEQGQRPRPYHLTLLALALDLPASELARWPAADGPAQAPVGRHIETYRRHRGMKRQVLAGLLGRPVPWVTRVEQGLVNLRVSELCELAHALRVAPGELLDGSGTASSQGEVAEVDRRSFMRYLAVLGGAGSMDLELLNLALSRVIRLDRGLLEDLRQVTRELAEDWEAVGPQVLSPAAQNHVRALNLLIGDAPAALLPELLGVVSDAASLAGFLAFKLDDRGRARGYLDLAEMSAIDAGDGNRAALALLLKAKLRSPAHGGGQAAVAAAMLEAAGRAADQGSRSLMAWLHYEHAVLLAHLEDRGALDLMDRSDAAFTARAAGASPLVGAHDAETQAGRRAECLLTMGRAGEATEILERLVTAGDPARVNDRTADRRDLGAACAVLGQPDRACAELSRALAMASRAGLRQKLEGIAAVRQRHLDSFSQMPEVRALDEQLRELL